MMSEMTDGLKDARDQANDARWSTTSGRFGFAAFVVLAVVVVAVAAQAKGPNFGAISLVVLAVGYEAIHRTLLVKD